jgi:L-asparaginase
VNLVKKCVQIITTGGTIASLPQANGDVTAALTGDELVQQLGVKGDIKIKSSVTIGSFAFDFETLYTVALDVIKALESSEVSGVVVTHGTDTMEETAFYLSLVTSHLKKPVIFTGAQLNASHSFGDGANNLRDAVHVVQSGAVAELGTMIVFSGFVHMPRDVRKVDTSALEAFESPGWGPIGRVDGESVIIARYSNPKPTLTPLIPKPVALIRSGIGMTGREFRQMTDGYAGVVVEAFGRGNVHPTIVSEVERLIRQGIPVVVTSRCLSGSVLPVYGGGGGGKDLERAGAWFAGDLTGEKARVLLGLLLAGHAVWEEMRQMIVAYSHP